METLITEPTTQQEFSARLAAVLATAMVRTIGPKRPTSIEFVYDGHLLPRRHTWRISCEVDGKKYGSSIDILSSIFPHNAAEVTQHAGKLFKLLLGPWADRE